MKKINIVKKSGDFTRIIKNQRPYKTSIFLVYKEESNDVYKFGVTVSKKVGNAVTRNRIKRQLKNIIDKNNYKNNFNCIIIIRREILNKTFNEIELEVNKCFNRINILKENI